jgi:thiamine-phosphate pyrophosphorylase
MAANQPLWPWQWLMTDERLGDRLWEAVGHLPGGAGIIFRHYRLPDSDRLALGLQVARLAGARNLALGVAGSRQLAERLGASLVHNPDGPGDLPCSMAVHDETEARAANEAGAVLAFVAPIYATKSHRGRPPLGPERAMELAALAGCRAIALGGMDQTRFDALGERGFYGFAGISCWLRT